MGGQNDRKGVPLHLAAIETRDHMIKAIVGVQRHAAARDPTVLGAAIAHADDTTIGYQN
jgi:hypothetical protein